ncbi:MAG: hypothetical protein IJ002_04965 [Clostridia bacterium]|nr:hypothetical protein [Clostridia bacterium]
MSEEKYNIPISKLGLSARSYNVLMRNGIDTVDKLLALSESELRSFRNLGAKSLEEIVEVRNNIAGMDIVSDAPEIIEPEQKVFMASDGMMHIDTLIKDTGLSVRARNCLGRAGYEYVSELIGVEYEKIIQIENMGKKTAEEIVLFAGGIEASAPIAKQAESLDERKTDFANALEKHYGLSRVGVVREIHKMLSDSLNLDGESLCHRMYALKYVREALKRRIIAILEEVEELAEDSLLQKLPQHLQNTTILQDALIELECDRLITYESGVAARKYITCREYANTIADERKRTALLMRLDGYTLEEIGQAFDITRERIRQIVEKALWRRPRFYEDKYKYIFETYDFSKEDFLLAFDEGAEVYNCLDLIVKRKGKTPISEILSDENVSVKMKRRAERAIYKAYVTVDGVRVLKQRRELVRFAVKRFAADKISYDDFSAKYYEWLDELGLNTEDFTLNGRTYENRLSSSNYVLWNQWRSFRYYNISDRDFTELLEAINISQYEDVELSALKFFMDFPELMQEYDIRDEYELHNLLKKIVSVDGVDFGRMPTIVIGNGDPEAQMLDLLIEHSPIEGVELCQKYEEAYGTRAITAQGNILSKLWQYCENGIYSIDAEGLAPDQFAHMKEVLVEDFYTLKDMSRIYQREFPESHIKQLNPYMIKSLGFKVYAGYAVKAEYSNAAMYFRHLLLDSEVVDGREFPSSFTYIGAYTSELAELKTQRAIFEYLPKQYINISRLESIGVGLADIEDYCKCVCDYVEHGEYFTVESLRQNGFSHRLDDLGFDDWFYASLITEDRDDFSYVRIGGTKLFYRGKKAVMLENFLQYLLEKHRKFDIYDLLDLLQNGYGLKQSRDDLVYTIRQSDMYYDPIMETAYIDYDTYYEEI